MSMPFVEKHDKRGSSCTTKRYFVQNQPTSFALINVASQSNSNDSAMRWRTSLFALVWPKALKSKMMAMHMQIFDLQVQGQRKLCPCPRPKGKGKANKCKSTICKKMMAMHMQIFDLQVQGQRKAKLCPASLTPFDNGLRDTTQRVARRSKATVTPWVGRSFVRLWFSCKAKLCTCFAMHLPLPLQIEDLHGHGDAVDRARLRPGNPTGDFHYCFTMMHHFGDRSPKVMHQCLTRMQAAGKRKKNRLKPIPPQIFDLQGHRQTQKAFRKAFLKGFQVNEYVTFSKLVPKELFLIQSTQNPCKTHYTIVRPLIKCSRYTITMACFLNRLPVYPDITNKKVRYSRNRIRKQIIPSLQFFFNPEVEKALFKFSELQAIGA